MYEAIGEDALHPDMDYYKDWGKRSFLYATFGLSTQRKMLLDIRWRYKFMNPNTIYDILLARHTF